MGGMEQARWAALLALLAARCLLCANAGALHGMARQNDVSKWETLDANVLSKSLDEKEEGSGQTPLMAATLAGMDKSVDYLLKKGADATIGEKDGYTPYHGSGFQGRADVAKILKKHGLDPLDTHSDGYIGLHRACWGREQRHTDTVRAFLKMGVDPNYKSKDGKTCLDMTQNEGTKK